MSAAQTLRPGRYRHFKGKEYELLFLATHSETLEPMVVYRALYGERGIWVRPAPCGTRRSSATGGLSAASHTLAMHKHSAPGHLPRRAACVAVC